MPLGERVTTMIRNLRTYVATNNLCRQVSDTTLLWLYIEKVGDDLRIVDHQWMGWEMSWDGTGVEPLIVCAPSYGERVTRKEMIEEIMRVYGERIDAEAERRRSAKEQREWREEMQTA